MKKLLSLLLIMLFAVGSMAAKDRVTQDVNVLPVPAKTLLNKYFGKKAVSHIKIDSDVLSTEYDVVLVDGTEIEFDKEGNWKEIECGSGRVPKALILKPINDFVAKNYKNAPINKVEKKKNKYEIRLSTGISLEFDRAGKFLRIDD